VKAVASRNTNNTKKTDSTKKIDKTKRIDDTKKKDDTKNKDDRKKKDDTKDKDKPANGKDGLTTGNRRLKDGTPARVGVHSNGKISDIQARGMTIHKGVRGGRTITSVRNGRTIVSTGPQSGYVQHPPFSRGGREYVQRDYVVGGRHYTRVYRDYYYGRAHYYIYAPAYYYHPAFYGWAYHRWAARVYYNWGWGRAPWFYGGYFAPAPYYSTASLWLTDYLLAANLRLAYSSMPGAGVDVPADQPWTDTGIELHEGDDVNISAAGVISYRPGSTASPAGAPPNCSVAGPQSAPFPAPQLPCWSLLGRIGESGGIFEVGFNARFHSNASGELYLGVNDNILGDNSGSWTASVQTKQNYQPDDQQSAPNGSTAATPMSSEVKGLVDAEVQRELQAEQAAAQPPQAQPANNQVPPPALDPAQSVFIVSSSLDVSTAGGQECELTAGDVLTRIDDAPDTNGTVGVRVMSSKANDCGVGPKPRIAVDDLQEMNNTFREQLDSGLKALADKSGTGGLPKAPDTKTSAGEVQQPTPDTSVDNELKTQQTEANQLEAQVR
jgi:hypothetical protein